MAKERKRYSTDFKLKAVLAVLKGDKTGAQLAGELGVHPMALSEWKHQYSLLAFMAYKLISLSNNFKNSF